MLAACSAPQPKPKPAPPPDPAANANRLLNSGQYAAAGAAFETLAASAAARSAHYAAAAMLSYLDAQQPADAERVLAAFEQSQVAASAATITAETCIEWARGNTAQSIALGATVDVAALTPYQRGAYNRCLGQAALAEQRVGQAAKRLAAAFKYPLPVDQFEQLSQLTWRALSALPSDYVAEGSSSGDTVVAGWYQLTAISHSALADPAGLSQQLTAWRQQYAGHPATHLLEMISERAEALAVRPRKLALLLPFDDKYKNAAAAIRDGFLSAWYADSSDSSRPQVAVYDTASEPIEAVLSKAQSEGAELIIGPLKKANVKAIQSSTGLAVPIVALNQIGASADGGRVGLYQFGLTPEDEASQVAQRAFGQGPRALVMVPEGNWGARLKQAYLQSWEARGGEVVEVIEFGGDTESFGRAVKQGLNIHRSEQRAKALRQLLNRPLHAGPRRRDDISAILLAAFPNHARQILPQLRYFNAADIPVFSTSHVYATASKLGRDVDLNGIRFGDMPWVFGLADRASFNLIQQHWPKRANRYARLFGFGIDAYRILPFVSRMRIQPGLKVAGVTGKLWMESDGIIRRDMIWMQFVDGIPSVLDTQPESSASPAGNGYIR